MVPDNSDEFPDGTLLADFWCRSSWTIDFQNSDEGYGQTGNAGSRPCGILLICLLYTSGCAGSLSDIIYHASDAFIHAGCSRPGLYAYSEGKGFVTEGFPV